MTKVRHPLSVEQAVSDTIDAIGMAEAMAATGRARSYLGDVSDQDKRLLLTCRDAIALDAAHERLIGGRPIHDMMTLMLDAKSSAGQSCNQQLFEATIEAMRESSEAHTALLEASQVGATPAKRRAAMRELVQAFSAKRRIMPILQLMMRQPAQPP
ncbi:hypothetical protein [Sphingomonas sp. Leaf4]|uniref:hypothetical protein n=1 Tax=Sphingomonas sp. Leaf4 TaxID=2876553 RepID=UPI001E2C4EBC|nr:hypothetical protein [Sphingomonas sp. Leaf4]